MTIRAVIFDLDGCLVDSEDMALETLAGLMVAHGVPAALSDLRRDCLGVSIRSIADRVVQTAPDLDPAAFAMAFEDRLLARYEAGLNPVPGAKDLVMDLHMRGIATAIATGSSRRRLAAALRLSGLALLFDGTAFSADQVARGKPAPDVFLFAADQLGIAPANCAVMEDSPHGIKGALAAGMRAVGFTGGSHLRDVRDAHAALLRQAGAAEVRDSLTGMADALLR